MALAVSDYDALKVLAQLIDEEIGLYNKKDLETVTEASMILFNRSLLMKFLK